MLSTLRAGKNVCSWTSTTKQFRLHFVSGRAYATSGRTAFRGGGSRQILRRYSSNEAKATVRAIPVESTRAGLTGKFYLC